MERLWLSEARHLSRVEGEPPAPEPDEVVIRVAACGVCGTDLHIVKGESRVHLPLVLGHEFGGTVSDVGRNVSGLASGDRAVVDPNIVCHACPQCRAGRINLCENLSALGVDRDGGMSDYCLVPQRQTYLVPKGFPWQGLALVEPLSCVLHGIDLARPRAGERVALVGAGAIGLFFVQLLRGWAGDLAVSEPNPDRRSRAARFGASPIEPAAEGRFDLVIEASGTTGGFVDAIRFVRRGGRVLQFGVAPIGATAAVSPNEIYSKELTIVGSYVNPFTLQRAIDLLATGAIDYQAVDIRFFRLAEFEEAFEAAAAGRYGKVVFRMGGTV